MSEVVIGCITAAGLVWMFYNGHVFVKHFVNLMIDIVKATIESTTAWIDLFKNIGKDDDNGCEDL